MSENKTDRSAESRLAAEDFRSFFGANSHFAKMLDEQANWTEQQWADHDAKVAAERAESERQEAKDREANRIRAFENAGWPIRALEAAQAADQEQPAVLRALSWKPQEESVLVLSGQPGCGKTTAAAVWALKACPWPPVFLRATSFAASSRYNHEQRDEWLHAQALVLDDLGAEYADAKGNFLVDLDELIDTFYGDKRPLLITTNCTADEFKQRYGARIVDRIRECGAFYGIKIGSLRGKK
jgi:DNA replication protein DnaC